MSLDYAGLQTALLVELAQAPPPYNVAPPNFVQLYPQSIAYAEGRIYQDIIPLAQRRQDRSLVTVAGIRSLDLSTMTQPIIVPEGLMLLTPAGSVIANGTRQSFDESSLDVIDTLWPDLSVTMNPADAAWIGRHWAMQDNKFMVFSPTPDGAYTAVIPGLYQPDPLSGANTTTYLTLTYPQLMVAGCMIYLSGALLRNFGAQSDDPKMAVSWEGQYQTLMRLALNQELRIRGLSPDVASPRQGG